MWQWGDGFDWYTDISQRYATHNIISSSPSIDATGGRFGGGAIKWTGSSVGGQYIVMPITGSPTRLLGQFHLKPGTSSFSYNNSFLNLYEGGTLHTNLRWTGAGGIDAYNANFTILGSSTAGVLSFNNYNFLEFDITIHDSTGSVLVRVNTNTVLNLTNVDTRQGATGVINGVMLNGVTFMQNIEMWVDDLIVYDTTGSAPNAQWLGDKRLVMRRVNGAGNSAQFTPSAGSNYQNVDDASAPDGDTTYNESSTVNHVDLFAMESSSPAGALIYGVQPIIVARKTDAGSTSLAYDISHSSTNAFGSDHALGDTFFTYWDFLKQNPVGPTNWNETDFNNIEAGYKRTV